MKFVGIVGYLLVEFPLRSMQNLVMESKNLLAATSCGIIGAALWPAGVGISDALSMSSDEAILALAWWVVGLYLLLAGRGAGEARGEWGERLSFLKSPPIVCVMAVNLFLFAWLLWPQQVDPVLYRFAAPDDLFRMALAVWLGVFSVLAALYGVFRSSSSVVGRDEASGVAGERRKSERRGEDRRKGAVPLPAWMADRRSAQRRVSSRRDAERGMTLSGA